MSYGLKQSQLIIKPLADATKGAIEFNRDVTGNPTDNVILQDVYLGDNETMVYNPNTGLVTGVVSHFKTAFINGELTTNSEYAVVASTLDGTSTPTTFTPSYFQVGQFAVTSGTLTDFGLGGTVDVSISAGQSLGHIDLLDNFVVMHPQSASIPGVAPKDMGLVFSKNADSSAAFYLDHTNGQFYLHNIAHADSKLDLHDLSVTSGTLSLATLNVGALNINGTAVTGGIDHFVDLTDVNVSLVDGDFVVYDGNTEVFTNRSVSSTVRVRLFNNAGTDSAQVWDTLGSTSTNPLTVNGSNFDYSIPAFSDMESTYLINNEDGAYRVVLPALADMDIYRSRKIVLHNAGSLHLTVACAGSDTFQGGATTITLGPKDTVGILVEGIGLGALGASYKVLSLKENDAFVLLNVNEVDEVSGTFYAAYSANPYFNHSLGSVSAIGADGLPNVAGYYTYTLPTFSEPKLTVMANVDPTVPAVGIKLPPVNSPGITFDKNREITIKATGNSLTILANTNDYFEDGSTKLLLRAGDSVTLYKYVTAGNSDWKVISSYRNSLSEYNTITNPDGDMYLNGNLTGEGVNTIDLGNTAIYDSAFTQEEAIFVVSDDTGATGDMTVTLFAANVVSKGFKVIVKRVNATRSVYVNRASTDTIDGETSIELPLQYSSITLVSNGSNAWFIL